MQTMTDYLELWRELVEAQVHRAESGRRQQSDDAWRDKAKAYDADVQRRWEKPDSSRGFMANLLAAEPDSTVLDIGAGTGAWTIFLAQRARHVTALEPSAVMLEILLENVAEAGLDNVSVIEGSWPEMPALNTTSSARPTRSMAWPTSPPRSAHCKLPRAAPACSYYARRRLTV
ncbi:MAG: class I SAM-dependent methyltransferase [Anaerolineae bacterium]|nr:class I SAM-dependent methyltransferase [Anaerolineae bacterium]